MSELRFDRAELRKPERTPQGFLRFPRTRIARVGIYEYRRADGSVRRELKLPEEQFASHATAYDAISITTGHPRRADGEPESVTADNVRSYEVGTVSGDAKRAGDFAEADLVVKDAAAIKAIESGRYRELSPGYTIDRLDETPGADRKYGYPGNPEGRWDAVQRGIRPNHLALVDSARGGSVLRLRMDAAEVARSDNAGKLATLVDGHQHLVSMTGYDGVACSSGSTSWSVSEGAENGHAHDWVRGQDGKITIGASEGHTHAILDEESPYSAAPPARVDAEIDRFASAHESECMDAKTDKQRADELEGEVRVLKGEIAELKGLISTNATAADSDALKKERARADEADGKLSALEGAFRGQVRARAKLEREASGVMGGEFRMDDLSDRQIHEAVVKRLDGGNETAAASDDMLRGVYTALLARRERNVESQQRVGEILGSATRSPRVDEQNEREKREHEYRNQWRKTLTTGRTAAEGH